VATRDAYINMADKGTTNNSSDRINSTHPDNGIQVRLQQAKPIPLDVTLNCANGELLALVGPSGSGKTTILRCIAGLATADSGRVACNEETWWLPQSGTRVPTHQRRVGMVFQSYALFDHMTARENIEVGMSERSSSEREQTCQAWNPACRPNYPVGSGSASHWPVRWLGIPGCCYWMNPFPQST